MQWLGALPIGALKLVYSVFIGCHVCRYVKPEFSYISCTVMIFHKGRWRPKTELKMKQLAAKTISGHVV